MVFLFIVAVIVAIIIYSNIKSNSSKTQFVVSFRDYQFIEIESKGKIIFWGNYNKSKSNEWIICWNDSDGQNCGGGRESGKGVYILYNAEQNKIYTQGKLERPNNGSVSDNGFFSLEDWHFGNRLTGTFYIFNNAGNLILNREFKANILNSALSIRGEFAICQTANSPSEEDGNKLTAFDLKNRVELFSVCPETGWANAYEFSENEGIFIVILKEVGKFRYDKYGNFIDSENYDLARLMCNKYDQILSAAEKILKKDNVEGKQAKSLLEAIVRARSLGADSSQSWKALALKLQGFTLEALGKYKEALEAYEEALKINSKIGVKHKVDVIRKKLGDTSGRPEESM
jgi:tetratricopeptide (TPR) repeat protein